MWRRTSARDSCPAYPGLSYSPTSWEYQGWPAPSHLSLAPVGRDALCALGLDLPFSGTFPRQGCQGCACHLVIPPLLSRLLHPQALPPLLLQAVKPLGLARALIRLPPKLLSAVSVLSPPSPAALRQPHYQWGAVSLVLVAS